MAMKSKGYEITCDICGVTLQQDWLGLPHRWHEGHFVFNNGSRAGLPTLHVCDVCWGFKNSSAFKTWWKKIRGNKNEKT